jgi:2-dehydro-3-deoxygalactonokinase
MMVRDGRFEEALTEALSGWPAAKLPILLSGMIGSRQGWREAPYVAAPAGAAGLARELATAQSRLGTIRIVPGVSRDAGGWPDVMRGEETEVLGALARGGARDGLFVMPGTHSKWVRVADGAVADFRTYLTGELFAAVKDHTIIGRLMAAEPGPAAWQAGFARGLAAGRALDSAGALLARLFSVRPLGLFERLSADQAEGFLSGLLIGAEIADGLAAIRTHAPAAPAARTAPVTVIAGERLTARYLEALSRSGVEARAAPPDCAAAGQLMVARAAGLID